MRKSEYMRRLAASFLCAGGIAVGNLFCLVTAFDIPVNTKMLVLFCILAAFSCSLACSFKRAWIGTGIFWLVTIAVIIWKRELVKDGFLIAVKLVLKRFADSYTSLQGLQLTLEALPEGGATYFMAAIGALLCCVTAGTVSRWGSLAPLGILSVLLLVPCMLIIESMPAAWTFLLLLGTYVVLIITQLQRRYETEGRYRTMVRLALPVTILVLVIAAAVSTGEHQRPEWAEKLRTGFKQMFESGGLVQQDPVTGEIELLSPFVEDTLGFDLWNSDISETDLAELGPAGKTGRAVMSVWSTSRGKVYLKGSSLGVYEDNAWKLADEEIYTNAGITGGLWTTDMATGKQIQIRTEKRSSILYLPYMPKALPQGAAIYYDAYISNDERLTEYSAAFSDEPYSAVLSGEYEKIVREYYTQVPEETRTSLENVLAELSNGDTDVQSIAEYVRSSAEYNLNTERMPEGEEFVSWFLEDSSTGYCVHFATAAAVLLRCCNIPARYVNGYAVNTEAGKWVTVTQDDAHAWVEYYVDGVGWRMLEVTPADSSDELPQETVQEERPVQPETPAEKPQKNKCSEDKSGMLLGLWILMGVAVVLILWWPMVRIGRESALKKGTKNERAVKYYRWISFLSRMDKRPVGDTVRELAMKAKFSKHGVSDEELEAMVGSCNELKAELLACRKPLKFVLYHYVLAL